MGVFLIVSDTGGFSEHRDWQFDFFLLLVISTLMIAASGNIINDYFDVKADRVNKPEKLIIDRFIKRRWAILFNWTFNAVGLSIALVLSYILNNWYLAFISFISINLLFFYSLYFKRKFLIGNLIVAFLTAIVPLQMFIFSYSFNYGHCAGGWTFNDYMYIFRYEIFFYCGFAFMLNFIREIIKDMADVKGDLLLFSSTLPIKMGFRNTKIVLFVLYAATIFVMTFCTYYLFTEESSDYYIYPFRTSPAVYTILLCFISFLGSLFFLFRFNRRKYYVISSNLIKIAMFFGLLTPLFL